MASLIKPALLEPGDAIAMIAPSGVVEADYIQKSTEIFESWGLKVRHGKNLMAEFHQFAGTDDQRLGDMQKALDDSEIKAIICARGGYGAIRIIDQINWSKFKQKPKWITGFSDITVFHNSLFNMGIQSVHSIMPINFKKYQADSEPVLAFAKVLFEGKVEYSYEAARLCRPGTEKNPITGGNLSLLYALKGTAYDWNPQGNILFIEDVGEQYYHIDRMMQSLKLSGKLENIGGLIVGGLSEMADNKRPFGKTPEEIIAEAVQDYNYPVAFNFPAGHIFNNMPIIMGAETSLNVTEVSVEIKMG
jgi:muramoyltetrapeptide carboxypeptidase